MIVYIVAILMILGLAYLQMMQGFFSSVIMAVCTIFSAAIAVALFPWFAATTGLYELQPTIAEAVSFSLLFVGPLIGLRFLADKFIRGDIYFDLIIDRIGGAIFGLFTGTVMIGALLVVIQLAPFGRIIWGNFIPFSDSLQREMRVAPFFPDEFIVGFDKMLSAGSMSAGEKFTDQHDNLLLEAFCARNTAGQEGQTDVKPGAVTALALYDGENFKKNMDKADNSDTATPVPSYPTIDSSVPTKVVVMRVDVNISAADDKDPHWWRLPATHFRLLCRESTGRETSYVSYYPVGYVYYDADVKAPRIVSSVSNGITEPAKLILERPKEAGVYGDDKYETKIPQDKINLVIDWIYVLPKTVTPEALFFRRVDSVKTPGVSSESYDPNAAVFREKILTTPPPDYGKKKRRRK